MARNSILQVRNNNASTWTAANQILAAGEFGQELDTGKLKIGDGFTAWNSLPYVTDTVDVKNPLTVSPTPPINPVEGDQWLESDSMLLYIFYDSYWVDVSSPVTAIIQSTQYDGGSPYSTYGGTSGIDAGGI